MQDDFNPTGQPPADTSGMPLAADVRTDNLVPAEEKPVQQKTDPSWLRNGAQSSSDKGAVAPSLSVPVDDKPVPVVRVLSVRGVEYLFMTLTLFFSAASLVSMLLIIINAEASFEVMAFPLSLLIVSLPLFGFFFVRLRRAELAEPALRLEASKRRLSQGSQLVTFLTCVFTVVTVVNILLAKLAGSYESSIGKVLANAAVILVFAGGIFTYYWFDEHKLVK